MGYVKKENRVQRGVRFPPDLYRIIEKLARAKHGGDFTGAVISLLSEGLDYLKTVERWKREGAARDAEMKEFQGESPAEQKDGSSP
jgi:hypothetical protein